jgi:hypothetical protein
VGGENVGDALVKTPFEATVEILVGLLEAVVVVIVDVGI